MGSSLAAARGAVLGPSGRQMSGDAQSREGGGGKQDEEEAKITRRFKAWNTSDCEKIQIVQQEKTFSACISD